MNRYDRNKHSGPSRFPIIILLCLISGTWIYNIYDDVSWLRSENSTYKEIISEKNKQVSSLIKIVDSLTYRPKDIIIHEDIKPKFIKKSDTLSKKFIKDTTVKNPITKKDTAR